MARFEKHFAQELTQDIEIRRCGNLAFNKDNLSNVISVELYKNGEPYSGGGTVAGACIRPDGETVPITNGTLTGNTASITLTGDCFTIPGQIGVGIQVVKGTIKTTVLKAIYNVELYETNVTADPGGRMTASIGQLVEDIEAATATIPASDMASLMAGIAPTFSDTINYAAGAYVYYGGTLYRFTADHAAGSWTGTDATAVALGNDVADLKTAVETVEGDLYGETNYTVGYYINNNGTLTEDSDFCVTDKIPVSASTGIHFYYGTYGTKIKLIEFASDDSVVDYWGGTNGQAYRNLTTSATTAYVRFSFPVNYTAKLTNSAETATYYTAGRSNGFIATATEGISEVQQAKNLVGNGRITVSQNLLSSGETLTITDMPLYLKKNHGFSFSGIFGSFTGLKIGQGYQTYRGKWFEIDSTNIVVKQYQTEETTVGTIAHGLTMHGSINISMMIDNDGIGHCVITTIPTESDDTVVFTHDFNMGYEVNGSYFVSGSQNLANVTFSAISADIKKPLWIFGDSYLGIYNERVGGQLKNYGYTDGIMLHGLAGQNSAEAYAELEKALAIGTPKFLVWTLGMNDSSADAYTSVMDDLIDVCTAKNVTLILYVLPTFPSRAAICEAINTAIRATGVRYINAYRAVDTNSSGEWATGLLASDGIHPTEKGAELIAQRFLVDVPEIMQYIED